MSIETNGIDDDDKEEINAAKIKLRVETVLKDEATKAMYDKLKNPRKKELLAELEDKEVEIFQEDYITLAVLCHLKQNVDKFFISDSKLGSILWAALSVQFSVITLLSAMLYAMVTNEDGDYTPDIAHSYWLFLVKVPAIIALHLLLSPQVTNALHLMKFANQQAELFVDYGAPISYVLGLLGVLNALTA